MRKILLILPIGILAIFLINTAMAEQTVKTIEIPLGFSDRTNPNQIVTYNFTLDVPDGISDVLSIEFIIKADLLADANIYGGIVFNGHNFWCEPSVWTVPPWNVDNYEIIFDCTGLIPNNFDWNSIKDIPIRFAFMNDNFAGNIKPKIRMTYYNHPHTMVDIFGTEYSAGQNGTVFLQLLTDNKQPVNNASCFVDIYYPDKTSFVDDGMMMYLLGSDGLYYYDLVIPNISGVYMVSAHCDFFHNITYSTSSQDTYIYSGSPTSNYGNATNMAAGAIFETYYLDSLVQFELNATQNISNVLMCLYASGFNTILEVQRITSSWNESVVTWDTAPSFDSYIYDNQSVTTGWACWNITDLYKGWANGTYPNYGMLIKNSTIATGSWNYSSFHTKEYGGDLVPRLMIEYITTSQVSEIRGSGELHVSESINLSEINVTASVNESLIAEYNWNYSNRTLSDIDAGLLQNITALSSFIEIKFTGGTEYVINENATLMAQFVRTESGEPYPVNDANCSINISWPNTTLWLSGTMSYLSGSNGIYYFPVQLGEEIGVFIADMECVSGNNKTYGSDTFHVSTTESQTIVESPMLSFADLMPTVSAMSPTSRVCIDNMTMREITEFNTTTGGNLTTYIVDQIINCPNGCLNGSDYEFGATCAGTSIKCKTEELGFFQGMPQFYWGVGAILMLVGAGLIIENMIRRGERKDRDFYGGGKNGESFYE